MKTKLTQYLLAALFGVLPLTWSTVQAQPFTFGNALSFNGVDQYVAVTNFGAIAPTNEVTVEFWAYAHALDEQAAFILEPDASTNRFLAHVSYIGGDTVWDFGDISTEGRLAYPNPPDTVSNWVHYALVASSSDNTMRIYRNGVLNTSKAGMTPFVRGDYELRVGGDGGFFSFNGRLDDFRVWNTARSENEIYANLNHTLVGNEPGLLLYYRFDAASGTVATNSATATGPAYNGTLVNAPSWNASDAPFVNFADGTSNVIDGITLSVSNSVFVGNFGPNTSLLITNSGMLFNSGYAEVGLGEAASNNLAVVTGTGSLWTNGGYLVVGNNGSGNQLVVSNGGVVANAYGSVGTDDPGSNNVAVVTGPGSHWNNSDAFSVGESGSGNRLVVNDGGTVANTFGNIGVGGSYNLAMVTGSGSLWTNSGDLNIGYYGGGNQLVVSNGGVVANQEAYIGREADAGNNMVVVTGSGSLWTNSGDFLRVGFSGSGNQLLVSNGGVVASSYGVVGYTAVASNSVAVVTGAGSLWTNSNDLRVGGSGSQLVVTNGGLVASLYGYIGYSANGDNNRVTVAGANSQWRNIRDITVGDDANTNSQLVIRDGGLVTSRSGTIGDPISANGHTVLVADAGSMWSNSTSLYVGNRGSWNQLIVTNSGTVQASNAYVGFNASSTGNRVTVDGGNLIITNSGGTGTLDIRHGTNLLNAGLIQMDYLRLTNNAGLFEFNGGTLITRGSMVDNGVPFVVGNGSSPATLNVSGNGLNTFNNGLVISSSSTLTGSGTVAGPITVQSGGNLSPSAPLGMLVLNSSPVLQGSVLMQINKKGINRTNNQIQVTALLVYGGSLVVSAIGGAELTVGDSFPLFSASGYGGGFTNVSLPTLNPGLMWDNKLLIDGSIAVIAQPQITISGVMQSGTNLVFDVSGGSPGGTYTLLTATNVTMPLSTWATNSTGFFDALGGITIIRGINPDEAQRYFNVRVP